MYKLCEPPYATKSTALQVSKPMLEDVRRGVMKVRGRKKIEMNQKAPLGTLQLCSTSVVLDVSKAQKG